jgi:hypothetical protein
VGPEAIALIDLLKIMDKYHAKKLGIWEFPRSWAAWLVRYIADPLFPHLITYDQFRLLFADNVGDPERMHRLLQRPPGSTRAFWEGNLGK